MKKLIVAVAVASTVVLSGCAGMAGQTITGSSAGDYGVGGAVLGGLGGFAACKLIGGSKGTCNTTAGLGAVAGGVMGYSQGKTLDEARARQLQEQIQRESGLRTQLQYAVNQQNQPVVNQQGQRQVQALQMPVARVEMVNTRSGGLNKKAVKTLEYMSRLASQQNADMEVYVPANDEMYVGAIRGVVNPYNDPAGPKLWVQRDINQYLIVLKPRNQ